jgi:hypothetical protein
VIILLWMSVGIAGDAIYAGNLAAAYVAVGKGFL